MKSYIPDRRPEAAKIYCWILELKQLGSLNKRVLSIG